MLYTRPSFADLQTRIATDLASMPASLREPLAAAWARACHGLHGHLDWAVLQTSPLTCELERLYDYATLYNVDRLMATAASGQVTVTGTQGAVLLAGTVMRGSNGLDYKATSAVTVGLNGTVDANVRCETTGASTNMMSGQQLTLTAAVAGVSSTVTVGIDGLTGGADDELVDDWRSRVADQWRTLVIDGARGGKPADYVYWAKTAHPSVTGALVDVHVLGAGSVVVRPICNGLPDRLPSTAVLEAVTSYLAAEAPSADVRVVAPLLHPVTINIALSAIANTASNRLSITDSLAAMVLDKQSSKAVITTVEVDAAIAAVTVNYTRVSPSTDVVCTSGEVFVLQPVVWS